MRAWQWMQALTATAMLGAMVACATPKPPPKPAAEPKPAADSIRRVGLLLPLSSAQPDVRVAAQALFDAAQLALFEADVPDLALVMRDTGGSPAGARRAMRDLLAQDNLIAVVGPLLADNVAAAAAEAEAAAAVPIIALSTDARLAAQGVFVFGFVPAGNLARVLRFAHSEGARTFGLMAPRTDYGKRARLAFVSTLGAQEAATIGSVFMYPAQSAQIKPVARLFADYDLRRQRLVDERALLEARANDTPLDPTIVARLDPPLPPDDPPPLTLTSLAAPSLTSLATPSLTLDAPVSVDVPTPLDASVQQQPAQPPWRVVDPEAGLAMLADKESLGAEPYDAVLLPDGGERLRTVAPLLAFYDLDPRTTRLLGGGLWDDLALAKEPALRGGWFAAPPPQAREAFRARFARAWGRDPERIASLGYDALALVAALAKTETTISLAALTDPAGFAGFDGVVRLTAEGLAERALAVMELGSSGVRVVSPAPEGFADLQDAATQGDAR